MSRAPRSRRVAAARPPSADGKNWAGRPPAAEPPPAVEEAAKAALERDRALEKARMESFASGRVTTLKDQIATRERLRVLVDEVTKYGKGPWRVEIGASRWQDVCEVVPFFDQEFQRRIPARGSYVDLVPAVGDSCERHEATWLEDHGALKLRVTIGLFGGRVRTEPVREPEPKCFGPAVSRTETGAHEAPGRRVGFGRFVKLPEDAPLDRQVEEHIRVFTGKAPFLGTLSKLPRDLQGERHAARKLFSEFVTKHHKPDDEGLVRIERIREATASFIRVLLTHTKPGHDRKAAIYAAREAMMWANASIAVPHLPVPD